MGIREWLKSGAYLPEFLRDFHAQKDVFKFVHGRLADESKDRMPTWIAAHIYTIDAFLWIMAAHGWTLQRCRAKQDFADLHEAMASRRAEEDAAFKAFLDAQQGTT